MGMSRRDLENLGIRLPPVPSLRPDLAQAIEGANAKLRGDVPVKGPAEAAASRKASATSRKAQDSGATAEADVRRACRRYRTEGRALVQKMATPVKRLGKRFAGMASGEFVAVYEALDPADGHPVDYSGVAMVGGVSRAVRFEVKATGDSSIELKRRNGADILPPHQIEDVRIASGLGAVAGVLARIEHRNHQRWFWFPFAVWMAEVNAARDMGRASIYLDRILAVGVSCDRLPCGAPDWLGAMEKCV